MTFLDDVDNRLLGASPLPWRGGYDAGWTVESAVDGREIAAMTDQDDEQGRRDAELIAHAPSDLHTLVEFAREVKAIINEQRRVGRPPHQVADIEAALIRLEEHP